MPKKKKYIAKPFETPKSHEQFTALYRTMIKSDAYKKLSHSARTVYTVIKSQYHGDYTGNRVKCPYKVIQEYGMNTRTIAKAIKELERAGFIEVERQGLVTGTLYRGATIYKFSNKWYEEPP